MDPGSLVFTLLLKLNPICKGCMCFAEIVAKSRVVGPGQTGVWIFLWWLARPFIDRSRRGDFYACTLSLGRVTAFTFYSEEHQ